MAPQGQGKALPLLAVACLWCGSPDPTQEGQLVISPLPDSQQKREEFFSLFPLEKKHSVWLSFNQQMLIFFSLKSIKVCPALKSQTHTVT